MVAISIKTPRARSNFNYEKLKRLQREAYQVIARQIRADLQDIVATWETEVDFDVRNVSSSKNLIVRVQTDNEIFRFVNDGTEPHTIEPKKPGGWLRFQPEYTAKTSPGILQSFPGGKSGGFVFRKSVQHPGTEARDFTGRLEEKYKPRLTSAGESALRQWLQQTTRPAGRG